ncbi:MAG: hypothetical protein A3H29_01910 [Acidobacteria bacterium RIFCSPLOWO2_02_FULL_67_21]|nr:MAG: hypothetical protein A3H29_01910 [Acidobacteria bacterium RIFCSPLOWO2_02_FULL_67_21]
MTGYVLALGSAALYGAADFLGGFASRRAGTIAIVVVSQAAGLVLLLALMPFMPAAPFHRDLWWGGVAGLAGGTGVALLYRALAVGRMAVAAPTTAVCAVIIPVVADVLAGQRLGAQTAAGIALALLAIALVSRTNASPAGGAPAGLWLALASGVAIGFFFLALARTRAEAGLWPLVAARLVSVSLFVLIGLASGARFRMPGPVMRIAVAAGAVDMAANALYLFATRHGALSVVVTLSSLYPASTVVLARAVAGERLNGWQAVGLVSALAAVALIVAGP